MDASLVAGTAMPGESIAGRSGGRNGLESAGWEMHARSSADTEKCKTAALRMEAIRCDPD
jgi:hypothetical protein